MTQAQAVIETIEMLGGIATLNQIAITQMHSLIENNEIKRLTEGEQ